ncbi:MAG: CHAT domain-containing tetratricopeptide repeat protein, partial [Bacteroidota bacterium]
PYALSDNEYYRDYINIKGLIFLNEGKHEDAITYFNKSISSYQNKYGPDYHVTSSIYVNLARAYFGMDRFDTSLECIQKALALNADSQWKPQSTLDNPPEISPKNWIDYFNTLTEKLTILQKVLSNDEDGLTKLTAQYAYIDRCVKMCRREISDTYDQFTYDDSFEKVYAEAINTSYDLYVLTDDVQYLHQCFYWLESHRGSTLLQSARTQFAMKNTDLPAEVVQAERELESQLALMKSALQSEVDTALLASYSQREFKLKYAYDSLISRIEQDYPSYVESKYNDEVVSVEEAQEQLARDEALIAFNVHDTTLFSFYLTREEFEVKRLTLDSTFDRHLQTLFDTYKDAVPYTKESMASSKYVYDVLIGTYEEKLNAQAIQTLTLMPDDQLHYLPFDALLVSYADGPSHLVEHVSSRNIYSVTIDQYALTTNKSGNKVLALAPAYEELSSDVKREFRSDIGPLLWNGEEVDNISQYFDTKQLKGMLASERSFKSEVANHDIIHLAMHALVDEGNFRNSKLILEQVPDSIEDGNLYLSELFLLDIQASLAVLSACETGIGTLSTANGPMSLSSAFHYAGVPSVAMSYWNVDDQATSTLMSSFYANLAAGMIKSEALRQAKLTYLQTASPDKRHPFYWASFSILGNDDPVVAGSGSNMWYIILVLIVIACSGYAFVKKKA